VSSLDGCKYVLLAGTALDDDLTLLNIVDLGVVDHMSLELQYLKCVSIMIHGMFSLRSPVEVIFEETNCDMSQLYASSSTSRLMLPRLIGHHLG